MNKAELPRPYSSNSEQRLLLARILDKLEQCQNRSIPTCSGFLTPEERAEAQALLLRLPGVNPIFFGGFDEAERRVCAFLPDWLDYADWRDGDDCPVAALLAQVPGFSQFSHRDYLGSIMGLGLLREKIGDILPTEAGAQVIVLRETLPILLSQWQQVGRYPVKLSEIPLASLSAGEAEVKIIKDSVASLRMDSVVASGFSISRSRAGELISGGKVLRNHVVCDKTDKLVEAGDVFSCRGLGKCTLSSIGGSSKKGRIWIEMARYI